MSLESILKRDRLVVLAGIAGVTALSWAYLWASPLGAHEMAPPAAEPAEERVSDYDDLPG